MRKQKWFDVSSSCEGFSRSCRSWKWWKLSELPPSLMLCLPASETLLLITSSWTRLLSGVFCVHGIGKVSELRRIPNWYKVEKFNRIWRFIRALEMLSNKKCEHSWKIICLGVVKRGMQTRCFGKLVYFYLTFIWSEPKRFKGNWKIWKIEAFW